MKDATMGLNWLVCRHAEVHRPTLVFYWISQEERLPLTNGAPGVVPRNFN
jgi:hypothetical protein